MLKPIRPVATLGTRVQEHGRIRFGVMTKARSGKMRPTTIDTWRFTSPDADAIHALAELYGGTVEPWNEPKANPQNQWQVITEAATIRVFLPPDSMTIFYEFWTAAGCQRRCDGVTATIPSPGPDGQLEVPCCCENEGKMVCKPRTRLRVILPEIRFAGIWRLDTGSWNAAEEMPAMETMLQQLATHGILEAGLSLVKASDQGGSRQYVVPRLEFSYSTQQLLEGASNVRVLNPTTNHPTTRATEIGPAPQIPAADDDHIIEAEIIEFPAPTPDPVPPKGGLAPKYRKLHAMIGAVMGMADNGALKNYSADDVRHRLVHLATNGRGHSAFDLNDDELQAVFSVLQDVLDRERYPTDTDDGLRFPRYAPGEQPFT